MTREKLSSKGKDKLQADMDKLFYTLTGKQNRPKMTWQKFSIEEIMARKERKKNGQKKFSK